MLQHQPLTDQAIRDTVQAVFSAARYDDRRTLWQRFWGWVGVHVLEPVWGAIGRALHFIWGAPGLRWTVIVGLAVVVALIVWRTVIAIRDEPRRRELRATRAARVAFGMDPLALAQTLAARGDFTGAAHALYAALLREAARRERLELHPSKTVGDYARDLRARSSSLLSRFREFGRSYEFVVYGVGECDRDRYERLWTLASPIVSAHG
ncbi:MAG TPA: DUF4129 domain-containing protein [Gemmatimonadaceae bacterium]|nr:DUF4129 domain-containing protein [Gemmatimonadaceae bacterium]